MKKEFDFVWTLMGTDNYDEIKFKFSKNKLSLRDALELERLDLVGYCDDEMNAVLNELQQQKEAAKLERDNIALLELMKKEMDYFKKRIELPTSFKLQSVTSRLYGKIMIYLLLYKIEIPRLHEGFEMNNL